MIPTLFSDEYRLFTFGHHPSFLVYADLIVVADCTPYTFCLVVNNNRGSKTLHSWRFWLIDRNALDATLTTAFSRSRVLIATDVWGRGLDVQQVSLVICYDLPNNRELYIHRCVSLSFKMVGFIVVVDFVLGYIFLS